MNPAFNLDVDLTNIDPTIPVLTARLYDLRIVDITQEENKEKTGFNAKIKFETTDVAESLDGKSIPPGFPLFSYYPMQPSNKADSKQTDPDAWKKNFAALMDAALGTETGSRGAFNRDQLIGKVVRANVKVGEYEGRKTNNIGALTKPTDS